MTDEPDEKDQRPAWEKREFVINEKMKEVCRLTIKATETEIAALLRKLEKLQYGGKR